MSQLATGIFGAIAVTMALGAAGLASGRDLDGNVQDPIGTPESAVNRAAKADRAPVAPTPQGTPAAQTQTISIRRPDALPDTSVLVRIPVTTVGRNSSSARSPSEPSGRKMAVACEPVVSVLTEIAKRLQPGRCVT
jgi:hypothetical protein